jgi:hypothetical protein
VVARIRGVPSVADPAELPGSLMKPFHCCNSRSRSRRCPRHLLQVWIEVRSTSRRCSRVDGSRKEADVFVGGAVRGWTGLGGTQRFVAMLFIGQAHYIGLHRRDSGPLAADCLTIDLPNRGHFLKYAVFTKSIELMHAPVLWSRR